MMSWMCAGFSIALKSKSSVRPYVIPPSMPLPARQIEKPNGL
jgi:hypothetical protein